MGRTDVEPAAQDERIARTMNGLPDDLSVPVRSVGSTGAITVRTARLPDGTRVGLAFTTAQKLASAMGTAQPSTRLCETALRALLQPLGIERIQVDAELVAPAVTQLRNFPASRTGGPAAVPAQQTAVA